MICGQDQQWMTNFVRHMLNFLHCANGKKIRNRGHFSCLKHLQKNARTFPTIAQKHFNGAETGILAKWLAGVTVGLAYKHPENVHMQLRAAVFINACAMREAVTLRQGPLLTPENYSKLETANYLFHSALNGLAEEAISEGRLLWKLRPKVHKWER